MRRELRIASWIFAAIFLLSAAVQWNDPDPLLWITIYLAAAGLSVAAALGRPLRWPTTAAAAVAWLAFLWLAPTLLGAERTAFTSFRMRATHHEEPREAVGLAIVAGWMTVLALRARGDRLARADPTRP